MLYPQYTGLCNLVKMSLTGTEFQMKREINISTFSSDPGPQMMSPYCETHSKHLSSHDPPSAHIVFTLLIKILLLSVFKVLIVLISSCSHGSS